MSDELQQSPYADVLPAGRHDRLVLDDQTADTGPTVIEPIRPRKRDWWRVLLGRWRPALTISRRLTVAGAGKLMKASYGDELVDQLNQRSPLLGRVQAARAIRRGE